jgi:hypothetical protein
LLIFEPQIILRHQIEIYINFHKWMNIFQERMFAFLTNKFNNCH